VTGPESVFDHYDAPVLSERLITVGSFGAVLVAAPLAVLASVAFAASALAVVVGLRIEEHAWKTH
jgi:hypothetical protein